MTSLRANTQITRSPSWWIYSEQVAVQPLVLVFSSARWAQTMPQVSKTSQQSKKVYQWLPAPTLLASMAAMMSQLSLSAHQTSSKFKNQKYTIKMKTSRKSKNASLKRKTYTPEKRYIFSKKWKPTAEILRTNYMWSEPWKRLLKFK